MENDLTVRIHAIRQWDARYPSEAYFFMLEAMNAMMAKSQSVRHLSAGEFLDGVMAFGLENYGPLLPLVLNHWHIHLSIDIGLIVFNLIGCGIFGKNADDCLEDFERHDAFAKLMDVDMALLAADPEL